MTNILLGVDLAQIEARATGWVAGAQSFLNLFLTTDPYCTYGRSIFGHEITKKDLIKRTASKATVLAFGFAGGIGAGQRVAENYKIDFEALADVILPTATWRELAEGERLYDYYLEGRPYKPLSRRSGIAVDILKQRYRRDFPRIVEYWDELEAAFLSGTHAGLLSYTRKASGLRTLTLPSGRQLFYHGVQGDSSEYSYQSRKGRAHLWKGVLIENAAQAINADISNWYKLRAHRQIAPVCHHCYDEFTMIVPENQIDEKLAQLKELTATKPDWADGLPLGFDYKIGKRYGK